MKNKRCSKKSACSRQQGSSLGVGIEPERLSLCINRMNPCRTRAKVSIFFLSLYCTTYFLHGPNSDQNKTLEQLLAPEVPVSREGFHLPRSVGFWTRAFGEALKPTTCVTTHSTAGLSSAVVYIPPLNIL